MFKDRCDYIGLTGIIKVKLPILDSQIATLITSVASNSPLSYNLIYSQVVGIRIWTSLGDHYSTCHRQQFGYAQGPILGVV